MHDLRIGAIRDRSRREQRFRLPLRQVRQEARNHFWNSAGGSTRRIKSASIKLGEKKSAPSGSQRAGMPASLP